MPAPTSHVDGAIGKADGWFRHPLWLVGFRPFFALAFVSAIALPVLWALFYSGLFSLGPSGIAPMQWHAHEMLFGFGWAVLGGFLLTASKNWLGVRGMHGGLLAAAAALWIVERGAILLPVTGPFAIARFVLVNACVVLVGGYVWLTLFRHRAHDTFKDNGFFLVGLPILLVAKNLLLQPATSAIGVAMTIGIFRLAFAVMFERTITQFMKGAMGVTLPRNRFLDLSIKGLILAAAFERLLPPKLAAAVLGAAAALLLVRFVTWKPLMGFQRFGIGIMYAGYLGLVVHLAISAAQQLGWVAAVGTLATHAFTLLCMGLIIPGMLIRICQGHTGRAIAFTWSDKTAFAAMAAAAFFRLVATQLWPSKYLLWIQLSAGGWSLCFLVIAFRLLPMLFRARADGKEH